MAKAQSFFGGTTPKRSGVPARQVGTSSATSGVNSITNNRGQADRKAYQPKTGKFIRPNIPGKSDNRNVGC